MDDGRGLRLGPSNLELLDHVHLLRWVSRRSNEESNGARRNRRTVSVAGPSPRPGPLVCASRLAPPLPPPEVAKNALGRRMRMTPPENALTPFLAALPRRI